MSVFVSKQLKHLCYLQVCTGKRGANTKREFAVNVFRTLTCLVYVLTLLPERLGALWGSGPPYPRIGPQLFNPLPYNIARLVICEYNVTG